MKLQYILVAGLLLATISCGSQQKEEDQDEAPKELRISHALLDTIPVDTVTNQPIEGILTVNGKVSVDDNKVIQIFPSLAGYATSVAVQLGDYVQKGQLLAVVHSADIANYENQLSDARSNLAVAEKHLKVQTDLKNSQLATDKDVTDAESDVTKAKAAIKQIEDLFRIYKKGEGASYEIHAPIAGYIIQKSINNGMEVGGENGESLFTISEINDVWVVANIFETDIPKVKEGYSADIASLSYPDSLFHGKIDKVYNFLDPQSKTMQARIKVQNTSGLLKPEMFTTVSIHYPGKGNRVAIPSSAIIFDNNTNYVLVKSGSDSLSIREVLPLSNLDSVTYIKQGLKTGEVIVTKDQLLLYNALLQ